MSFTGFDFMIFFLIVFALYWLPRWHRASGIAHGRHEAARLARDHRRQNALLLAASYVFYGWVHAWYAVMLGASTLADYYLAQRMAAGAGNKRLLLGLSLLVNLGVLAFLKYYNFFSPALAAALDNIGLNADPLLVYVFLPAGLSFYTLKKLGYMLDVSNGTLKPSHSLRDFALYVSFFPQIVAGPIERPLKLLPQLEAPRVWKPDLLYAAWPLLVMGLFKKIVIADSIKVIVDQIFSLNEPGGFLLLAGSLGFTLQILADFSAYTDLARGLALLLGFETSENFRLPYLALTPADFWNRWHITLSTWLRDYIFFPTRRAWMRARTKLPRVASRAQRVGDGLAQSIPPILTMFVSGLWHGAGLTFIVWGLYYGVLISAYQLIGLRGDWKPRSALGTGLAWLIMFSFIVFGWAIFRAPSLAWLGHVLFQTPFIKDQADLIVGLIALSMAFIYSLPLWIKLLLDRIPASQAWLQPVYYALASAAIVIYLNSSSPDFIYFQF